MKRLAKVGSTSPWTAFLRDWATVPSPEVLRALATPLRLLPSGFGQRLLPSGFGQPRLAHKAHRHWFADQGKRTAKVGRANMTLDLPIFATPCTPRHISSEDMNPSW